MNAREMRTKFASVLQRYFAGDVTLIDDIADNYVSPEPVNELARETLPKVQPAISLDTRELQRKKRQETAEWNMQRKRKFAIAEDEVKIMKMIGMGKIEHEQAMTKELVEREQKLLQIQSERVKLVEQEARAKQEIVKAEREQKEIK